MSLARRARRRAACAIILLLGLGLAARGKSLAAFDERCILVGCVAPRSNTPDILGRRALPPRRLARLAATPDVHHGLLTHAQEKPLPDLDSVLKGLRKTLHSDRALLSQYTYIEKNTEKNLDKKGRVTKTEVEVSEVYPSVDQDLSYVRVISKNGTATDSRELEKKDREQQKKVLERMGKLEHESPAEKEKRQAKLAEERRKEDETIDEAFALYSATMTGREVVDGRDAIVLNFRARPDFKVKTDNGKTLKKIAGRIWIDERDHELIRIELDLVDTISIGFGMLARLNPGAHAMFQRRLVNNEIWLPAEVHYTGSARVMLVKGVHLDVTSEYSGYKKFSVETATTFSPPKPDQ